MQKLIKTKNMKVYTHVILDEVHDRDEDMDFLFIVVRMLINPNIKVILMSATIDASKFAKYYKFPIKTQELPAPIIFVDQRRQFEVREFYYDELGKIRPVS
jgi:ATP-dependent RNA helicase TDRD9